MIIDKFCEHRFPLTEGKTISSLDPWTFEENKEKVLTIIYLKSTITLIKSYPFLSRKKHKNKNRWGKNHRMDTLFIIDNIPHFSNEFFFFRKKWKYFKAIFIDHGKQEKSSL